MKIEFDTTQRDSITQYRKIAGETTPYGWYSVGILTVCSIAQVLMLVWFEYGWALTVAIGFILGFKVVSTVSQFVAAYRFPSLHCEIEFGEQDVTLQSDFCISKFAYHYIRGVNEEGPYYLLETGSSIIVLPKRAFRPEQATYLLETVRNRSKETQETTVARFHEVFSDEVESYHYTWTHDDLADLANEQFLPVKDGRNPHPPDAKPPRPSARTRPILAVTLLFLYTFVCIFVPAGRAFIPIFLFLIANSVLSILSLRQNKGRIQELAEKLVGKEVFIRVAGRDLWIGNSIAIDQFNLDAISQVFCGHYFVAVQAPNKILFAIPQRSMGDAQVVNRFLQQCVDRTLPVEMRETGNPYQPPSV